MIGGAATRGLRWAISNIGIALESTRLREKGQSVKLIEVYEKIRVNYGKNHDQAPWGSPGSVSQRPCVRAAIFATKRT